MDEYDEMFTRANLTQLASFLISGLQDDEAPVMNNKSRGYGKYLLELRKPLDDMILSLPMSTKEKNKFTDALNELLSKTENVIMEIGLQCGILICNDAFKKLDPDKIDF